MSKQNQVFFFFFMIAGLFSCKTEDSNSSMNDSDFRIRLSKQPEQINPILFPNPLAREVYQYLFLPLAEIDPQSTQLVPLMIKTVPSLNVSPSGGYSIDIEILEEAKWTDGSPVTGEDYLFTLKSMLHPATDASAYKFMQDIISDVIIDQNNNKKFQVIFDDYAMHMAESALSFELLPKNIYDPANITGSFSLRDLADSTQLAKLSLDSTFMRFAAEFNSPKYTREIISGSGPYEFSEWVDNEAIVLKRKANYWAANMKNESFQARPEKIVFIIIPDETGAITQLASGNIDLINGVNGNTYEAFVDTLKNNQSIQWLNVQLPRYYALILNNQDKILSDKNVRKALQAIVNVDEFIKNFENGNATKMTSFVAPFLPGFDKDITNVGGDMSLAKSYLEKSAWRDSDKDGVLDKMIDNKKEDLKLQILPSGALSVKFALLLKEECAKAGIEIDVVQKEFALTRKENINTRKFQIIPTLYSVDLLLENPYDTFHSENALSSNISSYKSTVADSLIDVIITTKDDKNRIESHHQLQKLIYDDAVMIFLYAPIDRIALSHNWIGKTTLSRPGYKANTFVLKKN